MIGNRCLGKHGEMAFRKNNRARSDRNEMGQSKDQFKHVTKAHDFEKAWCGASW